MIPVVKKLALALTVLAFAASLVACSSDEPSSEPEPTQPTMPQSEGDQCADPVGDLTSDARTPGVGTEPAGVDITAAAGEVQDDQLAISITTAGPVDTTPGTTYAVAQGTPFTSFAFEVRATATAGDNWDVEIITWDEDEKRARKTAHEIWPLAGLGGTLFTELAQPSDFESAYENVSEEKVAESVVCGPDPDKHLEAIQEAVDAGYTHLCIHQVGPDQEGFFDFYEREILPRLTTERRGQANARSKRGDARPRPEATA